MIETRDTHNFRRWHQETYTYFAKLPTLFKVFAYLTLVGTVIMVLVSFVAAAKAHPIFLLHGLLAVVYGIVGFLVLMGLSEWAKVAMETHVNTLEIGAGVKRDG